MITDQQLRGITSEIATARERWLAFWLGQIMPPVLVRWVSEGKNLKAVADYMVKHRIRREITQGSNVERLMHGDKCVASFEVKTTRQ